MFKLRFENRLNFKASGRVLIRSVTFIFLFLLTLQVGLFFYNLLRGALLQDDGDIIEIVKNELFFPYVIYACLIGCMASVNGFFNKRKMPVHNVYAQLSLLSLLCFCVSMANAQYILGGAGAIMAIPLMAALIYIDYKPLNFSLLLNTILLIVFCIFNAELYHTLMPWRFPNFIVIMFALLFVLYLIVRSILVSAIKLVEESAFKDQRLARDSFTGLLNHAAFYNHLDQLIIENHRTGIVFSLIIWDIDNFKSINDRFGHEIGDRVLTWFIRALKDFTDEDHDLCFRYGGEEFAVLLRKDTNAAYQLSCDVRQRFTSYSAAMPMLGQLLTASAGICEYNRQFGGSREFFSAADRALYTAKRVPGKNTSTVWTDGMFDQSIIRQYLKRSMFLSGEENETEEKSQTNPES